MPKYEYDMHCRNFMFNVAAVNWLSLGGGLGQASPQHFSLPPFSIVGGSENCLNALFNL